MTIDPPRKVIIQSNGSPGGTVVFDETGRQIKGAISKIEWSIEPGKTATAALTFENVEIMASATVV